MQLISQLQSFHDRLRKHSQNGTIPPELYEADADVLREAINTIKRLSAIRVNDFDALVETPDDRLLDLGNGTQVVRCVPSQEPVDPWTTAENVGALIDALDESVLMKTKLQREADRACAQHHEVARKLMQAKETIVWLHAELAALKAAPTQEPIKTVGGIHLEDFLRNEIEMCKRMCGQLMAELGSMNEELSNRKEQIAKLQANLRPTDDALWDQTLQERDCYHEIADKLACAIAEHFGVEIGEHSSMNNPWENALDAIEKLTPVQVVDLSLIEQITKLEAERDELQRVIVRQEIDNRNAGLKPMTNDEVLTLADEHLYGGRNYGVIAFARAVRGEK